VKRINISEREKNKWKDIGCNMILPLFIGTAVYVLKKIISLHPIIVNYLPDGLWAYALQSCILIIWNRKINWMWTIALLIFCAGFEILQKTRLLSGTGDIYDFLVYVIFMATALLFNNTFNFYFYKTKTHAPNT
jgi:hypothetical protein